MTVSRWRFESLAWLARNPGGESLGQTEARLRVVVPKLPWQPTAERLWAAGELEVDGIRGALTTLIDTLVDENVHAKVNTPTM